MLSRDRLVRVVLYGPLADEFGQEHSYAVHTPQEAVRALSANFPGFRPALVKHDRYGIFADGDWREGEDAALLPVSRELHLVPIIEGRAFAAPLMGIAIGGTTLGAIGTQLLIGVVVSALVWGVSQLFAKPVETDDSDKRDESYIFSGADNTTQQGSAVPVVYGRCFVGSVVISASIEVTDQQITGSSGGRTAMRDYTHEGLRGDQPQDPTSPLALRGGEDPLMPPLELQNVGLPDRPIMRVGPVGWRHMGMVVLLEEDEYREVDLFIPPEAGSPYRWDYWRGFERWQPGETGMLGT